MAQDTKSLENKKPSPKFFSAIPFTRRNSSPSFKSKPKKNLSLSTVNKKTSIKKIVELLKTDESTEFLDLRDRKDIYSKEIKLIVDAILSNPKSAIKEIDVSNNFIGPLGVELLNYLNLKMPSISKIELKNNVIPPQIENNAYLRVLSSNALQMPKSVQSDVVESNDITDRTLAIERQTKIVSTSEFQKGLDFELYFINLLESIKSFKKTKKTDHTPNKITEVKLASKGINLDHLELLIARLDAKNTSISTLNLCDNRIDINSKIMESLIRAILKKEELTTTVHVDLRGNNLDDDSIKIINEIRKKHKKFTCLIDQDFQDTLIQIDNKETTEVNLYDFRLTPENIANLMQALRTNEGITKIDLSKNGLEFEDIENLLKLLAPRPVEIILDKNKIDKNKIEKLKKELEESGVEVKYKLSVEQNFPEIVEALKKGTIQKVYLDSYRLNQKDVKELAEAIRVTNSFRELYLTNDNLSSESLEPLIDSFIHNVDLLRNRNKGKDKFYFNLEGNKLDDEAAAIIYRILRHTFQVETTVKKGKTEKSISSLDPVPIALNLQNNCISEIGIKLLTWTQSTCSNITSQVRGNFIYPNTHDLFQEFAITNNNLALGTFDTPVKINLNQLYEELVEARFNINELSEQSKAKAKEIQSLLLSDNTNENDEDIKKEPGAEENSGTWSRASISASSRQNSEIYDESSQSAFLKPSKPSAHRHFYNSNSNNNNDNNNNNEQNPQEKSSSKSP